MINLPLLRMLSRQRNDWAALDAQYQTKLNLKALVAMSETPVTRFSKWNQLWLNRTRL
eukprot:COSAG01_NODE_5790_length_4033_cov_7.794865_8_plen_57_part_01